MSRPARPMALAELLGMRPGEVGEGRSTFDCDVASHHMNPYGVVHGGVVYTLVDYAMGSAVFSRLERGERCATLEIKINYVAAVTRGKIRATAVVVERTTRIAVVDTRVHDEADRLIAVALGTFYIQRAAGSALGEPEGVDSREPGG